VCVCVCAFSVSMVSPRGSVSGLAWPCRCRGEGRGSRVGLRQRRGRGSRVGLRQRRGRGFRVGLRQRRPPEPVLFFFVYICHDFARAYIIFCVCFFFFARAYIIFCVCFASMSRTTALHAEPVDV